MIKLDLQFFGGRGAGSESSLFGGRGENNERGRRNPDLPAKMNRMYNGNNMSIDNTISVFEAAHKNAGSEHLIAYDDNGFVSVYTHGGKHAVGFFPDEVAGKHVIHNHPSGSHFSMKDLQNLSTTGEKSITATSRNGYRYTATKTAKFDAKGWSKALSTAKTSGDTSTIEGYNKAVHNWLKRNASKYGVDYTRN